MGDGDVTRTLYCTDVGGTELRVAIRGVPGADPSWESDDVVVLTVQPRPTDGSPSPRADAPESFEVGAVCSREPIGVTARYWYGLLYGLL
ncbi:hypothetical protein BRC61_01455 [Halobacteriales archaeon QH_10_65_19]|nr:MAG: hypothetical protein BRC61_01455 [Halobacteriales archaeon QH_10_65_19]